MEARNGVGNFKADIEEVNSRIQGRAGTSIYIIAADGPATISREISEPLLPKHSLPFLLIELTRRGVRGLGKGRDTACAAWGKESPLAASYGGRYPRSALQIKVA